MVARPAAWAEETHKAARFVWDELPDRRGHRRRPYYAKVAAFARSGKLGSGGVRLAWFSQRGPTGVRVRVR